MLIKHHVMRGSPPTVVIISLLGITRNSNSRNSDSGSSRAYFPGFYAVIRVRFVSRARRPLAADVRRYQSRRRLVSLLAHLATPAALLRCCAAVLLLLSQENENNDTMMTMRMTGNELK